MRGIQISVHILQGENSQTATMAIFMCDSRIADPFAHLNLAVAKYAQENTINQYVPIEGDNPFIRIVIHNINSLKTVPFVSQSL